MNDRESLIFAQCDGVRTSKEIAAIVGDSMKYVQRTMKKYDLPRLPQAPRCGEHNPAFVSGRKIDRDGYVLVRAPLGHPNARMRQGRAYGVIYEHRLMIEDSLGRILERSEAVDHIDGLRLHNTPSNLRVFGTNGQHLTATISNQIPLWSKAGREKLRLSNLGVKGLPLVQTYARMKKSGDARLIQILRALLQFGIDSPHLLGTHHHLAKVGIFDFSHSSLELELALIYQRYE